LLRYRGQRYITTRQFNKAINDLQQAAFYARNAPNELDPDEQPNAFNRPVYNIKFNIWYHLGLAYYIVGNYDKAISSFKKSADFTNNNDLVVLNAHWLYSTYRKIGNDLAANDVINEISSRMRLLENRKYHDLIMLYRGFVIPDLLINRNKEEQVLNADVAYGIGNWYLLQGQMESARNMFNNIIGKNQWDNYGYIAAEAEINNLSVSTANAAL
jgi:tetratricopeptide (TPR) repeat protein